MRLIVKRLNQKFTPKTIRKTHLTYLVLASGQIIDPLHEPLPVRLLPELRELKAVNQSAICATCPPPKNRENLLDKLYVGALFYRDLYTVLAILSATADYKSSL